MSRFAELVAESHGRTLPVLTRRTVRLPWLKGKVDAVVGMRRTGKTWALYQRMAELLREGVPREATLYVNFEDERLDGLVAQELGVLLDEFFRRAPQVERSRCALFLDEVQVVPGWERFVRRVVDSLGPHVVVSGSSAKLLGSEIASALRGRALTTEVFPFSLEEAMRHAGVRVPDDPFPAPAHRAEVESFFLEYLRAGGFPEVQGLAPALRSRILADYLDVAVLRDVIERYSVGNVAALRRVVRQLLRAPATLVSVNRLHGTLKSMGIRVGKDSLYDFVDYLEDAYLFFQVPIYSDSERVRQVNPTKVYAVDTGLSSLPIVDPRRDRGRLLESFAFLVLRRQGLDVAYYRTTGNHEVDFVWPGEDGEPTLAQVCADMSDPETRDRELRALFEGIDELGLSEGVVVTLFEEGEERRDGRRVRLVPAWRWALFEVAADG